MCLSPSSSNKIKATLHLDSTDAVHTTKLFYVWRMLSSKSSCQMGCVSDNLMWKSGVVLSVVPCSMLC